MTFFAGPLFSKLGIGSTLFVLNVESVEKGDNLNLFHVSQNLAGVTKVFLISAREGMKEHLFLSVFIRNTSFAF